MVAPSLTDRTFRIPAIRLAEAQLAAPARRVDVPVHAARRRRSAASLGACHALEIPFVWDNLDAHGAAMFVGEVGRRAARRWPTHMADAWVAFARDGDPVGRRRCPTGPATTPTGGPRCGSTTGAEVVDDPRPRERAALGRRRRATRRERTARLVTCVPGWSGERSSRAPTGVLLVQNRRRNGRLDWTPPGGVIDDGEACSTG